MIMTMRSFKLIVAGFILGVGLPIHIGMMGEMYVVAWALIACWAALLIHKYAAQERAVLKWIEHKFRDAAFNRAAKKEEGDNGQS
jgi:hypothetical protein